MIADYLSKFPIQAAHLPKRLRKLLEPVGNNPQLRVEVTSRYDEDQYGPNREFVQMIMAVVPSSRLPDLSILQEVSDGVVNYSRPDIRDQGELAEFYPSVSGFDFIVASTGNGSFYSYNLAEKVWMSLGLSPRCLGGDAQHIFYDDLSLPEFGVAEGQLSTEYHFSPKRNVRWTMSNEYLRRYLWMRGAYGVHVFFYEANLPDSPDLRKLMSGQPHVCLKPDGGWCELDIREHRAGLLLQVWATVAAVSPELCDALDAGKLVWPGIDGPMTHDRANSIFTEGTVYLDDQFLERYEQSGFFDTLPVNVCGQWCCSPSYRGQWTFTECVRVGRNVIKVPVRELYKAKPDREIIHAHAYALDPVKITEFDQNEEHIVAKTQRLVDELLRLGDQLASLSASIGVPQVATDIFGFSREEMHANGWLKYPALWRLAQVAPLAMTEQAFLSRCKNLHELWQRIPNEILRTLIVRAGHARSDIKNFGSLKLLQVLSNIIERLNKNGERVDAFGAGTENRDLDNSNSALAPLFVNYDLRIADAHDAGEVLKKLETLGFDVAGLNQGYGTALDHVFDCVIRAFEHLNSEIRKLLTR